MDFGLGEEVEGFRKEVLDFFTKERPKEFRNWRGWLQPDNPGFIEKAEEFGRKLAAKGWLGIAVPKKYGGTERSIVEQYVLFDEVKRADWPPQLMSQQSLR
jgi:acyl-CoA dehydrogenase